MSDETQMDAPPALDPAPVEHQSEPPPPGVRTMAVVRWALVALMGLVAAAALLHHFHVLDRPGQAAADTQIYYCPMHPSVTQDHPGECPICSMTLVPKPAGAGSSPSATMAPAEPAVPGLGPVDLSAERIQLLGMKTAKVERTRLGTELRTVGVIAPPEQGLAQIQARFAGWIERVQVTQTGARIGRGQVLATIYSPEVLAAQQELINARRWSAQGGAAAPEHGEAHELSGNLGDDSRHRLELLGIGAREIEEIERTGKALRGIPIRSPVDGYVIRRGAVEGLHVEPGTELFAVANLARVWLIADVYEHEAGRVSVGTRASMTMAAYPGQTFTGRVQFVYPTVDAATRTLKVRVELANPGLKLRPGMYGDVVFATPGGEALVVPDEAVVDTGEHRYVFVSKEGGRFEPRAVKVGGRADGKIEIVEGLADGETVVTTGNFLIDSESRLRAAIEGEGGGAAGMPRMGAAPGPGGGKASAPAGAPSGSCAAEFGAKKYPDKFQQCRQCELVHRGMGTMEEDCKKAIPKPWK